jgi:hypothetical protein
MFIRRWCAGCGWLTEHVKSIKDSKALNLRIIVNGIGIQLNVHPDTKVSDVMWAARVETDYGDTNGERGWQMLTKSGEWCLLDEPISKYANDLPLGLTLKPGTGA